jgi:acyl carrier protein
MPGRTQQTIEEQIIDIVVSELDLNPTDVQATSSLTDDLGADSLDVVNLIMAIEMGFNLEIPDEDANGINTVADIASYVKNKLLVGTDK